MSVTREKVALKGVGVGKGEVMLEGVGVGNKREGRVRTEVLVSVKESHIRRCWCR